MFEKSIGVNLTNIEKKIAEMNKVTYVDHETGEIYETKALAMEAYRGGHQINLYTWSDVLGEWTMRGYWEV